MGIDIIIFGCGGVGSWLAEFLVRADLKHRNIGTLTLVDGDKVEAKNLERQNFVKSDIGRNKALLVANKVRAISNVPTVVVTEMIERPEQLARFSQEATAIITTDTAISKVMMSRYFNDVVITNCDHDFAEIKSGVDRSEKSVWSFGNGYTSSQDIQSNIRAAQLVLTAIEENKRPNFATKVQSERMNTEYDLTRQGQLQVIAEFDEEGNAIEREEEHTEPEPEYDTNEEQAW